MANNRLSHERTKKTKLSKEKKALSRLKKLEIYRIFWNFFGIDFFRNVIINL